MLMLMLVINRCYQHRCYGRSLAVHWLFTGCSLAVPVVINTVVMNTVVIDAHAHALMPMLMLMLMRSCSCAHAHAHAHALMLMLMLMLMRSCSCSCLISTAVINTVVMAVHWLFTDCSLAVDLL